MYKVTPNDCVFLVGTEARDYLDYLKIGHSSSWMKQLMVGAKLSSAGRTETLMNI